MQYNAFIYEDHLEPKGLLPRSHKIEASACWHFCRLANRILINLPEQVVMEGETDKTVSLRDVLESVRIMYGLDREDGIGMIITWAQQVQREALRCGLPWSPRLTAWFESGGKAYNIVTREPGALNVQ